MGSPIGLSDTEIVDLKLMLKTDIAEKGYRNKSQIYEDIVELLLDRFHEIYYLQEWRQLLTSRPQAELSDH